MRRSRYTTVTLLFIENSDGRVQESDCNGAWRPARRNRSEHKGDGFAGGLPALQSSLDSVLPDLLVQCNPCETDAGRSLRDVALVFDM